MTDNPTYRGQGQGRPGDEYYDDRYGRPQEEPRAEGQEPRAPYTPEQGGYPPQGAPNYPPRQGGYPEQGGYPDQGGYPPPSYEQRPPAGYGPPSGGYDQGYRQGPGYGAPQGGYGAPAGAPPGADYDYGRPDGRPDGRPEGRPAPGRPDDYGRPEGRPGYPDQGGYDQPGYPGGGYGRPEGRPEYGQPEYGRYPEGPGGGYGEPPRGDYDYGQPPAAGGYSGYGQGADYRPGAAAVTLQLDDGSGRTYQLREGANVIGRGQDAQFRLPDTGVSRRHLEIRWDGQVALLSDLNSTNGTTVNNAPVQEWQLADGDVIRLGHSEIVVRVH
jgi:FHA domain